VWFNRLLQHLGRKLTGSILQHLHREASTEKDNLGHCWCEVFNRLNALPVSNQPSASKHQTDKVIRGPKTTTSSADAGKPARRVYGSVKVTKHSTIPYAGYSFLLRNSNFVVKTCRFSDIQLQKCCDFEIRVRGHSRSLKVVPFDRLHMVSY